MRFPGVALLVFSAVPVAAAAIWPDQIGTFARKPSQSLALQDRPLYEEFGYEAMEQAEYAGPAGKFTATAWRMRDATGAMALFEARRPSGAQPAKLAKLAVTTSDGVILAFGNYVIQFTGHAPSVAELTPALEALPRLEQSPLPALIGYLPVDGLTANSERYVLGPVSLERFEPRIPPSVAAFHLGAEAQIARYGDMNLAVFAYPTPSMARERAGEFSKLSRAVVKRTGPLVAVILEPADPDAAERLLAKVNYDANLTWNETPKAAKAKGFMGMIGNAFLFSGIMVLFCLVFGVAFGGLRFLRMRYGKGQNDDGMITLGLEGK